MSFRALFFPIDRGRTARTRAFVVLAALTTPSATAGEVRLVSRLDPALAPRTPAGATLLPSGATISDDGRYVVFTSTAVNVASGQVDSNGGEDVFLRDRLAGTVTLVSRSRSGPSLAANGPSWAPMLSADGRVVAFYSSATDLTEGQVTPGGLFLLDPLTGAMTRLPAGGPPLAMSTDGRYIAFGGLSLFDRVTGTTSLVAHVTGSPTTPVAAEASRSCMSGNGRYLVFQSAAANILPDQTGNGWTQTYLIDRQSDQVRLVSHGATSATELADASSMGSSISRDGRYVVFASHAANLIAGFSRPWRTLNLFIYSLATGSVRLISHDRSSLTAGGDDDTFLNWVQSGDGEAVAFTSNAGNLLNQPAGGGWSDAFLYLTGTQANSLVSRTVLGAAAGGSAAGLSLDGSKVLFASSATNVVPGQVNPAVPYPGGQMFWYDRPSGRVRLASHSLLSPATTSNFRVSGVAFSGDGSTVAFASRASDLATQDENGLEDVFAWETTTEAVALLSPADSANLMRTASGYLPGHPAPPAGDEATQSPDGPFLSADGRYSILASYPTLLAGAPWVPALNLFLFDRHTGGFQLITHAMGDPLRGTTANPSAASISTDGRYVAYLSPATLAPNAGPGTNCYVWDRLTGLNTSLSPTCQDVTMSPDGRFAVYDDGALRLLDRGSGVVQLVSRRAGTATAPANGPSKAAIVTADGRWVVFGSSATDLVSPGTTGTQVFLFDAQAGTTTLVSHRAGAPDANANANAAKAALSADGAYVAFVSAATDLVAGQIDQPGTDDVFLYERATGLNRLVSHTAASSTTAGGVVPQGVPMVIGRPSVSDDGRFVAFLSGGDNLVAGQTPNNGAIRTVAAYLHDRLADQNILVSYDPALPARAQGGVNLRVSGMSYDGSAVLLTCDFCGVANQVSTQSGWPSNVFRYDRATGENALVSRSLNSPVQTGNGISGPAALSRSGDFALFSSEATDLVVGDLNGGPDIFLYATTLPPPAGSRSYYTVTPCRLVDTRFPGADWGSPALSPDYDRSFTTVGRCGIPTTAKAVSLNVTVTEATSPGHLKLFAAGEAPPTSVINYAPGQTRANSAVLFLGSAGEVTVRCGQFSGSAHLILDVNGYFE